MPEQNHQSTNTSISKAQRWLPGLLGVGTLTMMAICVIGLFALALSSIALNVYLVWQLSGFQVTLVQSETGAANEGLTTTLDGLFTVVTATPPGSEVTGIEPVKEVEQAQDFAGPPAQPTAVRATDAEAPTGKNSAPETIDDTADNNLTGSDAEAPAQGGPDSATGEGNIAQTPASNGAAAPAGTHTPTPPTPTSPTEPTPTRTPTQPPEFSARPEAEPTAAPTPSGSTLLPPTPSPTPDQLTEPEPEPIQ